MTILRILFNLGREIKNWDRASQIALAIALILFVIDIIVLATVPELQTQAAIGGIGLMLAIQAIVMWGNRNLVTAFTQAQRLFIAGEFAQAASVLEEHIAEEEHPVIDTLVLLGNTYRNLGRLEESRDILTQALERRADYHFALYAYGKTALAEGQYDTAMTYFQQAIDNDAPDVIAFDLVLTTYLLGDATKTQQLVADLPDLDEPHRQLFLAHITADKHATSLDKATQQAGLAFWQAEVDRFAHTPYGQQIAHETEQMKKLL